MKYDIIIERSAEKFIMKLPRLEKEVKGFIVYALVIIELYIQLIMVSY